MTVDLHCHTTCSDGTLSPEALLQLAADNGVTLLSITDHDTVQAYEVLRHTPRPEGLTLVPGIEFSTSFANRGIHVLGLDIDPFHRIITEAVAIQSQTRFERAEKIGAKLKKIGIEGAFEGAMALASEASIGRPHFAQFLIQNEFCKTTEEAFNKYLGDNRPGFVKQEWASLETVIHWITTAGGKAVIAHPDKYKMTRSKLVRMVQHFKSLGGHGMEILCARQAPHITQKLSQIAQANEVEASMGSDFHSPSQVWLRLGMHQDLPKGCQPVWEGFTGL